ncbi:cellulase-like family protein (plasmid) [Herbiconiux sp. KACC 21604]|uniref:cellulase-like family protein n=1 Tax=unclassified Herbiconiux TaxID=2618217 RepID=UPI001492FF55|nr:MULTISPECIES: cellulase-like family protein [unclassified Herbiconiux]QJU56322.1 cellulase [Herbiconiux sp. SALV-R1]WPO88829.1 cellulase-like family protein [Herbiconiux sp. KACC 21604]
MNIPAAEPYAITMWDFSWLERRWPGAGYEDWDEALSQLVDRGYNAVRIDAYPHLIAANPDREWELFPNWDTQSWGAQSNVRVRPLPALTEFLKRARHHGVRVSLSSWFREDVANTRVHYDTPERFSDMWITTLRHIEQEGLLDTLLFVDLCNEYPLRVWAPWLYTERLAQNVFRARRGDLADAVPPEASRTEAWVAEWMNGTIDRVRAAYPNLKYTYSFSSELATWRDQDVSSLDLLETHIWLANNEFTDYYDKVGYRFEKFSPAGYDNVVQRGREEYYRGQEQYDASLFRMIDNVADWSRATGKPLAITECWSLVDYKDWPGLEWDWILDINARAVEYALGTGRFVGLATSNFCGPQFVGMWREVDWHRRLTTAIKSASIDEDLRGA